MHINIVEAIQQNLEYPPLKKIDPNTQEVKDESPQSRTVPPEAFAQAAIPAVLTGMYLYSHTHQGEQKLRETNAANWLDWIFGSHSEEAVQKVATYASSDPGKSREEMERIAAEAVRQIKKYRDTKMEDSVKHFLVSQRNTILSYLPAALQMGDLLRNDALDDRTNKMHGPMSDHMHFLEKLFSSSGEAPHNTATW